MILAQINVGDAVALQTAIAALNGVTLPVDANALANIAGTVLAPTAVNVNGTEIIVEAIITGHREATRRQGTETVPDYKAVQNVVATGAINTTTGRFTGVRNTFKSKPGEFPVGAKVKLRLMELKTKATPEQLASPGELKIVGDYVISNYWQVVK